MLSKKRRLTRACRSRTPRPWRCGKTRLALKVAGDLVERFEDGVWLVELDSLSDPALVPQAIAPTLEVREAPGRSLTEVVVEHLKSKKTLLVFDNCEHLIDACAALANALLHACQDLKVLATSREALDIAGLRQKDAEIGPSASVSSVSWGDEH